MRKLKRKTLKDIHGAAGIEIGLPLPVGVCLGILQICQTGSHCRADGNCYPDVAGPCINGLCPSGYFCRSGECVR